MLIHITACIWYPVLNSNFLWWLLWRLIGEGGARGHGWPGRHQACSGTHPLFGRRGGLSQIHVDTFCWMSYRDLSVDRGSTIKAMSFNILCVGAVNLWETCSFPENSTSFLNMKQIRGLCLCFCFYCQFRQLISSCRWSCFNISVCGDIFKSI